MMTLKVFSAKNIIISLLAGTLFSISFAQSPADVLEIAMKWHVEGKYENAIHEARRLLFFSDSLEKEGNILLARCYASTNEEQKATDCYIEAIQRESNDSLRIELLFEKIHMHTRFGNPVLALIDISSIKSNQLAYIVQRRYFYSSLCYFQMEEYQSSIRYAHLLLLNSPDYDSLYVEKLFTKSEKNQEKSSMFPVILSTLVPGSGQLILGYTKEALNSFTLNASLITITAICFYQLRFLDAFITSYPLFRRYYLSGIINTKNLSHKRKKTINDQIYNDLLDYFNTQLNYKSIRVNSGKLKVRIGSSSTIQINS